MQMRETSLKAFRVYYCLKHEQQCFILQCFIAGLTLERNKRESFEPVIKKRALSVLTNLKKIELILKVG